MIHFLELHFVELVTITSIIYLTLATILLLYQTPDTAVYKTFRRSKRLMAGGMMLISLNIWIWIASFTGSWTEYNNWVPCFDIILFYLMGICFSFSLSSLLDPHYISRKRCRTIAVKFTMTAFFALIAMTVWLNGISRSVQSLSLGHRAGGDSQTIIVSRSRLRLSGFHVRQSNFAPG